jgi:hypothetical protein
MKKVLVPLIVIVVVVVGILIMGPFYVIDEG